MAPVWLAVVSSSAANACALGGSQLHCPFELWRRLIFDSEIPVVKGRDPFYIIVAEIRTTGNRRKFYQLLLVVNVREHRSNSLILEQPEQGGLSQSTLFGLQEPKLFDLPYTIYEPGTRTMAPMIVGWEDCLQGIVAFEHSR